MPAFKEKIKKMYDKTANKFLALLIGASSLTPLSAQNRDSEVHENKGIKTEIPVILPEAFSHAVPFKEIAAENEAGADTSLYVAVGSKSEQKKIAAIVETMQKSRVGRALLKEAKDRGYRIGMTTGMGEGVYGQCIDAEKMVYLYPLNSKDCQVHALAHELTHAVQNGDISNNLNRPNVLSQLMVCTAVEAGANTMALLVCHELDLQGESGPKHSLASIHGTMVRIFDNELKKGGKDLTVKKDRDEVLTKTFLGWYRQPGETGREIYTKYIDNRIADIDQLLRKKPEVLFLTARYSPATVVKGCCRIPGSEDNFFDQDPKILSSEECLRLLPAQEQKIEGLLERRLKKNPTFPVDSSYTQIVVVADLSAGHYSKEYKEAKKQEEAKQKIEEYQKRQNEEQATDKTPAEETKEAPLPSSQGKAPKDTDSGRAPSQTRVPARRMNGKTPKNNGREPPKDGGGRNPPLPKNPNNMIGKKVLAASGRRSSSSR